MADFSVGDAVGSGFGLIARRPVSVIVWGWIYLLIIAVPYALLMGTVLSEIPSFIKAAQDHAMSGAQAGPPPEFFAMQARMMLVQPLFIVCAMLARAVTTGAIYRSVLEPENKRWLSLRLGKAELWLALVHLAYGFVVAAAIFAIVIASLILCFVGWAIGGAFPHGPDVLIRTLFIVAAVIGAIVASIWVAVRLSLGPPMTFDEKEFRLFESWSLTKGHVWELFGLGLIMMLIAWGVGVVVYGFLFGGLISMFGGFDEGHIKAFFDHIHDNPQVIVQALAPRLGVFGLLAVLLVGPIMTIFLAPWAVAYRALRKGRTPEHPPVF